MPPRILKWTLVLTALTGAAALAQAPASSAPGTPEQTPAAPAVKQLTDEEILKAVKKKKIFKLDVRDPNELETLGTVKGYVNIPLSQLEARLHEIPKDKLILTI